MAVTMTQPVDAQREPQERSEAQLKNDVSAAKRRLAANLEGLVAEAHPQAVVHEVKEQARTFAQTEFENAKQQVKDEYGWRVDRMIVVGGAVLGAVTFLLVVRALTKRAQGS